MPRLKVINQQNPVIEVETAASPAGQQRVAVYIEAVGKVDVDASLATSTALKAHRERLCNPPKMKKLGASPPSCSMMDMAESAVGDFVATQERALEQARAALDTIGADAQEVMFIEKYDGRWLCAGYMLLALLTALIPLAVVFNVVSLLWAWWLGGLAVYCSVLAMNATNGEFVEPRHANFLLNFLIFTVRFPIMWSYVPDSSENVALHLSLLQLFLLMVNLVRNPHPIGGVFFAIVLLGTSAELLTWSGNTSKQAFGVMGLTMTLVMLLGSYAGGWRPIRSIIQAAYWAASCIFRRRTRKSSPPTDENYMLGLLWLRRFLVLNLFLSYVIFAPAVARNDCASPSWLHEWLGFLAIIGLLLLLSWKTSPLVKLGIGSFDEGMANSMVLAANCFCWCSVSCSGMKAKLPFQLFMTAAVAIFFFVGLQFKHYKFTSVEHLKAKLKPSICLTVSGRIVLIVICLASLTVFTIGPIFSVCSFVRGRAGCQMTVPRDVVTGWQYQPLKLGDTPGIQTDPSKPRLNVTFDKSLLVGLHNAYHQESPLASIVQSWGWVLRS